jgi:acyl transferase domain-containing protein/ubiquinone/menaquinone biosynthesis C-methylase UbiE/acyl carrier protein
VKPAVVIGHSVGEYAAACVAGIFPLNEGLTLVAERARLMQELPSGGAMAAVMAPETQVSAAIADSGRPVAIAAVNSPQSVVISGAAADVDAVCARIGESGVQARRLNVSHAFHSALVDPMLAALERAAALVTYREPQMDVISNLTGRICAGGDITPEYWRRHTRQPVRFADGIATALEQGCHLFVEIGPTPQLSGLAAQCTDAADVLWLPSLRRGRPDTESMLSTAGRLYARGARIDWRGFDRDYRRRKVALPTYPFQRERFWPEHRARAPLAPQTGAPAWTDWLYGLEWERRARSGSSASFLPQPAELAANGREQVGAACAENNTVVYDALYPALDAVCTSYIVSAFRALGVTLTAGQRLTAEEAARTMGVKPAHRRLLGRLFRILEEDGVLRRDGDGWTVAAAPGHIDPAALVRSLLDRFPSCSAEINLTAACAPSLAQVLTGRVDPLQVLFPRGDFSAAAAVYEHAPALRVFNTLLAERIADAVAAAPPQSTLRVLEIGGGTGSATSYVLPRLGAGRTEYTFSDVSAAFLPRAQEKFARFDFVKYQVLDVEEDPARQGFKAGSFDIVVAANVVHATRDIRETLGKIRTLLAPGGLLFLLEGTRTQRFGDLTVGYTEGWWRFADTDLRPDHALLTADQWKRVLQDEGFTGSETFPDARVHEQAIFENQSIIIARVPVEQKTGDALRGSWLVCGNPDGLGARLAAELRRGGATSALAVRGDAYSGDPSMGRFTVDAESRDHLARALRELAPTTTSPVNAIHLWALEERAALEAGVEDVSRCGSALALAQALAELPSGAGGTLTYVTRNAQPASADGPPLAAVQSPLWGLGRVVDLEHPELRCLRIDLGPHPEDDDARAIVDELEASTGEERQVALRGADRSVLRMVRRTEAASKAEAPLVRPDASYLVTGGLAGLGLEVARWLVDRGATRLVLASRSAPSTAALEAIAALGARGASVAAVQADVSTPAGVDAIFAACAADPRPLRGVIHSAGVTDDASLLQQRWERFEKVMAAKVRGSWLLHTRTAGMPLDFFLLFSSGASFIGSPGQSNHAAANAFLDALAFHRRTLGLPALSINWGAWSEIGAATRGDVLDRVSLAGLNHIDPAQGLAVLEHLMRSEAAQTAVLPIRWPEFLTHAAAIPRVFFERVAPDSTAAGSQIAPETRRIVDDVRSAPAARRRPMLMTIVEREACRVLGLGSSTPIDPTQPLNALGLDSLMAVELRNALAALAGHPLPATLLFNYPTVVDLVEFLASEMALDTGTAEETGALEAPAADTTDLESLSEDEIAALLAGKLAGASARTPGGPA